MTRDDDETRAQEIVDSWVAAQEEGATPPVEDWVRAHPDLEDELRAAADAIGRLRVLQPIDDAVAAAAPRSVGGYRIVREIGRGGMGVVYQAEQTAMRRKVALKVLYPSITNTAKAVERFQREARAPGRLQHTNIVTVHELGEDAGTWFCAMELVEGHSLDRVLDDLRRLRPASRRRPSKAASSGAGSAGAWKATTGEERYFQRVAEMFAEVADGLQLAHEQGVVHRDVKPANLILATSGRIKILDFGLARIRDDAAALTMTGGIVGTPAYMSPEQARSQAADARSDVWSLGATLYEVLTLRVPFHAKDVAEILQKLRNEDVRPPSRLDRRIPRDLETIVTKALEKDPSRRYAAAGDLARDLRAFAEGRTISARRTGPLTRGWRLVKRRRLAASLVAAVVVLAAALTAYLVEHGREAEERRIDAEYARLLQESARVQHEATTSYKRGGGASLTPAARTRSRDLLATAQALAPARCEAYVFLAIIAESTEDALALLDEARARGYPERRCRLLRARMLQIGHRTADSEAEFALAQALPDDGDCASAKFEGLFLLGAGRHAEAVERLTAALGRAATGGSPPEFSPGGVLFARGSAREEAHEFAAAIEDFSRVRSDSRLPDAALDVRIASLWRKLGKEEIASREFAKALAAARADGTSDRWSALCASCDTANEWPWLDASANEALEAHPDDPVFLTFRATARFERMDYEGAIRDVETALRIQPQHARALHLKVRARIALDRIAENAGDRKALSEAKSDAARDRAFDAVELMNSGRGDEAVELMRRLAKERPNDHPVHHGLGNTLAHIGRWSDALAPLDRAIELDRRCGDCWQVKAWCLNRLGRPVDALRTSDEGLVLAPETASLHRERGRSLSGLRRFEDALSAFDVALRMAPRDSLALTNRGFANAQLGRQDAALADFAAAFECDPRNDLARTNQAISLMTLGRSREALDVCATALRDRPDSAMWHSIRGEAMKNLGDWDEAVRALRKALEIDAAAPPRRSAGDRLRETDRVMDDRRRKVARVNLIKALAASGQDAEARAECELFVATAGEPSNSDEAGWLASALGPLGRFREMGEARELALRMNPRGANEHDDLAWFLATVPDSTLRDAARAVELMREVVSPATSDPAHWNTFGVVLCMAGKWQESLDALRKSMDLRGGGDAYDWYFLAIDEKRLGRDAEARAWFDKAVAWTEANRPKDEELARFRREAGVTLGIDADRTSPAPETK